MTAGRRPLLCPECGEPVGESIVGGALTRLAHEGRDAVVLPLVIRCGRRVGTDPSGAPVYCEGQWTAPAAFLLAIAPVLGAWGELAAADRELVVEHRAPRLSGLSA